VRAAGDPVHPHPGAQALDLASGGAEQVLDRGHVVVGAQRGGEVSEGGAQLLTGAHRQHVLGAVLAVVVDAGDGGGGGGPVGSAPQQGAAQLEALDAAGDDVVGARVGQAAAHPQPPLGDPGDEAPAGFDTAEDVLGQGDECGQQ